MLMFNPPRFSFISSVLFFMMGYLRYNIFIAAAAPERVSLANHSTRAASMAANNIRRAPATRGSYGKEDSSTPGMRLTKPAGSANDGKERAGLCPEG